MARKTVEAAGGFPEELARIDAVRATHGDNHVPLVAGLPTAFAGIDLLVNNAGLAKGL